MKTSELILKVSEMISQHGDLEIYMDEDCRLAEFERIRVIDDVDLETPICVMYALGSAETYLASNEFWREIFGFGSR